MESLDRVLKSAVESGVAAGIVGAAASREGLTYNRAFGRRAIDKPDPMTSDTIFRIFSMTKAVGGVAAAKLYEQGVLDLDAPAEKYAPAFGDLQVLEGFDGDTPRLRPPKRKATVRQLATHTCGLAYQFWSADTAKYLAVTNNPGFLSGTKRGIMYPLLFDPGERWEYGLGLDWLGQVIEGASGKRLDRFCREEIFKPLGMSDTDFECQGDKRARLATVHARREDGSLTPVALDPPSNPEVYSAGFGLYSTARDYMQFLLMLLNDGSFNGARILKPETVKYALSNYIGDLEITKLETVIPQVSFDAEFFPGMRKAHSLIGMINCEDARGMRAANSHCWAGALNTYFWFDPTGGVAGIVLMQSLPFADPRCVDVLVDFEKAVYADRRLAA